ncbi:MAG: hypothetical protein LBB42_00375 [Coriobacteriales bacterium]|jgi:hypothetical protein|nr:hypothetical protein [Coriobacteriales bacterium]
MEIRIAETVQELILENKEIEAELKLNSSQIKNLQSALLDPRCTGNAYETIKNNLASLRLPTAKAHNAVLEAILHANETNITELRNLPTTSLGVLSTDKCNSLIAEFTKQNQELTKQAQQEQASSIAYSSSVNNEFFGMISSNLRAIEELKKKITTANTYNVRSKTMYETARKLVESVLKKSTDSVKSYLATGTYGDISWKEDADNIYRLSDDYLKSLSRLNEGSVYISDDKQYLFFEGKKWKIASPYDRAVVDSDFGVFTAPEDLTYSTSATVLFSNEEFCYGQFLANFGNNSHNVTPDQEQGKGYTNLSVSQENIFALNAVTFLSGEFDNAASAMKKYEFALQFEECETGGQRVRILGKDSRLTGISILSQIDIHNGNDIAAAAYSKVTGKDSKWYLNYDVVFKFDKARNNPDAFMKEYYFNEQGEMMERLIRYPDDKLEISVNLGLAEKVDITDYFFQEAHYGRKVSASDKSMIMEGIKEMGLQ